MKRKIVQALIRLRGDNIIILGTLELVIVFGGMAVWAYADSEPIARVEVYTAAIMFVPVVPGENHLLTISGNNGLYVQKEFSPEQIPSFALITEEGLVPDGSYRYELRTQPDIGREELKEAELAGDSRRIEEISRMVQEQVRVQTRWFEIAGGVVVLPEKDEDS